jgi:hypothetical protein
MRPGGVTVSFDRQCEKILSLHIGYEISQVKTYSLRSERNLSAQITFRKVDLGPRSSESAG